MHLEHLLAELRKSFPHADAPAGHCINCGEAFSAKNVYSPAGWKETQISQLCEKCFDGITGADCQELED